jgi:hypothetical protein
VDDERTEPLWLVQWNEGGCRAFCGLDCLRRYLAAQGAPLLSRPCTPDLLFVCTACFACGDPIDATGCVICSDDEAEHHIDAWEMTTAALWVAKRLVMLFGRPLEPDEWEAVLDASYEDETDGGNDGPAVLRVAYVDITGEDLPEDTF